ARVAAPLRVESGAGLDAHWPATGWFASTRGVVLDRLDVGRGKGLDALGVFRFVVGQPWSRAELRRLGALVPRAGPARPTGGHVPGAAVTVHYHLWRQIVALSRPSRIMTGSTSSRNRSASLG